MITIDRITEGGKKIERARLVPDKSQGLILGDFKFSVDSQIIFAFAVLPGGLGLSKRGLSSLNGRRFSLHERGTSIVLASGPNLYIDSYRIGIGSSPTIDSSHGLSVASIGERMSLTDLALFYYSDRSNRWCVIQFDKTNSDNFARQHVSSLKNTKIV